MTDRRRLYRAARRLPRMPLAVAAFLLLAAPGSAGAQVFGQLSSAAVLPAGERTVGAYGVFTDESWGGLGHVRLGLGAGADVGASLGFASYEDAPGLDAPNTLRLGLDGRYQLRWAQPGAPVDASIGLALGLETGEDFTRFDLAPELLAGHRIVYDDAGRAVTPYGSVLLDYQSIDTPALDDDDIDLLARFGGAWEPSPGFALSAELGFGNGVSFAAGARWSF